MFKMLAAVGAGEDRVGNFAGPCIVAGDQKGERYTTEDECAHDFSTLATDS